MQLIELSDMCMVCVYNKWVLQMYYNVRDLEQIVVI